MTRLPAHPGRVGIVKVDCGTCHACCKQSVVILPEEGDDLSRYETEELYGRHWLKKKPAGSCVYLGEAGCTIWPNHPAICRAFDCAGFFMMHTRAQRRRMLKEKQYDPEVYKAGQERVKRAERAA